MKAKYYLSMAFASLLFFSGCAEKKRKAKVLPKQTAL